MKRIRTIKQAIELIKSQDPDTAISEFHLRQLVIQKKLICHKAGSKYLIDMDKLEAVLSGDEYPSIPQFMTNLKDFEPNKVRKIEER